MDDRTARPPARSHARTWRIVGITLVVVAVVAGLFGIGLVILFVVALNSYGSNK